MAEEQEGGGAKEEAARSKVKKNAYSNSAQKMTCPYCPRVFPWASSLQRHMLTHTGNPTHTHTPLTCCTSTFRCYKKLRKLKRCNGPLVWTFSVWSRLCYFLKSPLIFSLLFMFLLDPRPEALPLPQV